MSIGAAKNIYVEVNREHVLSKLDYFMDVQLWPLHKELNPTEWLSNFPDKEERYALHLLNSFMYFAQPLIDQMFRAAFQALSSLVINPLEQETYRTTQANWQSFMEKAYVTQVTGESPNPSDSGFQYQRMARQLLGISQEQIITPQKALKDLHAGKDRPLVFVDDFVGSGRQFIETWHRKVHIQNSQKLSFCDVCSVLTNTQVFYCPLICTEYGKSRIESNCPQVIMSPAHFISDAYGACSKNSIIWPKDLRQEGVEFLEKVSARAGIPTSQWKGFHDLGLALAFERSVPDATLPIFYWNKNGWHPLLERK